MFCHFLDQKMHWEMMQHNIGIGIELTGAFFNFYFIITI